MTEQDPLHPRPASAAVADTVASEAGGARRPLARRPQFWFLVAAAALLIVVAMLVGTVIGGTTGGGAALPSSTDSAGAVTTPPGSTPSTTPIATEVAHGIPTECAELYTRDWSSDFAPLVLNPAWTLEPGSGVRLGSTDDTAVELLEANAAVTCTWASPAGGSDRGLTTNAATVSEAERAAMLAHFGEKGYVCYEELEGTRCVIETAPSPDGQSGESHFFRDDVWIATHWVNAGPDGYTHDIVAAIFD
ncbi:hypothetical protein [Agromyces subbeticus]|uniref:hypothetical protein n=1 Tax=Agromyces subbeticus TaxID=293890 RepID=UPI0003B4509B|nr:hypothetical protein [Agromyces subbeticus]